jgi:WD40 repeat protein
VFSISSGKQKKDLLSSAGHTDWVESVAHAQDGRILSGGMDGKLCLWDSGSNCVNLTGHKGSISKVLCGEENLAISSSWDKTVKVWDLDSESCIQTLSGHTKRILDVVWQNSFVGTAGRDGLCCIYDINTGERVSKLEDHEGPVQCVKVLSDDRTNVIVTGGADGTVCLWDLRSSNIVGRTEVSKSGIGDIGLSNTSDTPRDPYAQIVVSAGDASLSVLDPRNGFQIARQMKDHKEEISKILVRDNLVISCGGNGWVLVHDYSTGKCLYGLETTRKGLCTCLTIADNKKLITAGDDGSLYLFGYA